MSAPWAAWLLSPAVISPRPRLDLPGTVLPALVLALLAAILAASTFPNPAAWRTGEARWWSLLRARPIRWAGYALAAGAVLALPWLTPRLIGASPAPSGATVAVDDWRTFHADAARTGAADSLQPPTLPTAAWKFREARVLERLPYAGSPAVAGDRVLIGGDSQRLYCLNLLDGSLFWTFEARAAIFSSPAVSDGRVYFGEGLHQSRKCRLYCLDLATGRVIWSFQTASHTESSPAVHEGKVYFGAGEDGVYCCDARDGRLLWNVREAHVDGAPLVVGDRVYFGSGYGTTGVFCVRAADGRVLWRHELPGASWGAPAFQDGRLFVGVGNGTFNESADRPAGQVRCLDAASGRELWRFTQTADAVLTSVAVSEGHAVFGSRDGRCYAVDPQTGGLLWRAEVGAPILSSPAVAGGRVFLGADDGKLRCLMLENGREIWAFDTSDDVLPFGDADARVQSSPALARGRVLFGASNGTVYCLGTDPASGPAAARTRGASPVLRAADGFLIRADGLTGNYGIAIMLAALLLRIVLLPLDWAQARQRRPALVLGCVLVQVPFFMLVVVVLLATPVLAGKPFLWIPNLGGADTLFLLNMPLGLGHVRPLSLVLAASIGIAFHTGWMPGRRLASVRFVAWTASAVVGLLVSGWPAGTLLFITAMLWFGFVSRIALRRIAERLSACRRSRGEEAA